MTLSTALCRPMSSRRARSSPAGGEQCSGVETAGTIEHPLGSPHGVWHAGQGVGVGVDDDDVLGRGVPGELPDGVV